MSVNRDFHQGSVCEHSNNHFAHQTNKSNCHKTIQPSNTYTYKSSTLICLDLLNDITKGFFIPLLRNHLLCISSIRPVPSIFDCICLVMRSCFAKSHVQPIKSAINEPIQGYETGTDGLYAEPGVLRSCI